MKECVNAWVTEMNAINLLLIIEILEFFNELDEL
jgi:hypothetical protein